MHNNLPMVLRYSYIFIFVNHYPYMYDIKVCYIYIYWLFHRFYSVNCHWSFDLLRCKSNCHHKWPFCDQSIWLWLHCNCTMILHMVSSVMSYNLNINHFFGGRNLFHIREKWVVHVVVSIHIAMYPENAKYHGI